MFGFIVFLLSGCVVLFGAVVGQPENVMQQAVIEVRWLQALVLFVGAFICLYLSGVIRAIKAGSPIGYEKSTRVPPPVDMGVDSK